jgi:transcriptional regulator with XRE-family HTH domain
MIYRSSNPGGVRGRTDRPLREELELRLAGRTLRALARDAGVTQSYLWRVLRAQAEEPGRRPPSVDLVKRVAAALGEEPGYFPEYRTDFVVAWVRSDPELRDELYDRLDRRGEPALLTAATARLSERARKQSAAMKRKAREAAPRTGAIHPKRD